MVKTHLCPCGSGEPYNECCGPLLEGVTSASSAEALMRSRYTAFVTKDSKYLLTSWHPSTRPAHIDLENDPVEWQGLTILGNSSGTGTDRQGEVTFRARFDHQGETGALVEKSRFVREEGSWFYLDGEQLPAGEAIRVGRNSPCPCGSGKKYKRCCGS